MTHPTWRGVTVDARTKAMLEEVARITPADLYVHPTQGSYRGGETAGSAGTHDGGGVVDLRTRDLTAAQDAQLLAAVRRVGFAGWLRVEAQGFEADHLHAVAVQPGGKNDRGVLSRAAHDQVIDYFENRNGLANNRRDDGPRTWVGTTWETYQGAPRCPGTITPGARGSAVRAWQAEMVRLGWLADTPGNADGFYGEATQRKARDMQRRLGVPVDAILGSVTWAAMEARGRV
jgi:hypothetical protein